MWQETWEETHSVINVDAFRRSINNIRFATIPLDACGKFFCPNLDSQNWCFSVTHFTQF
jgi:hypothetical protein